MATSMVSSSSSSEVVKTTIIITFHTLQRYHHPRHVVCRIRHAINDWIISGKKDSKQRNLQDADDSQITTHYHRHEHFYPNNDDNDDDNVRSNSKKPRMMSMDNNHGPSYNVRANPDYVEATFVFPNRKDDPPFINTTTVLGQSLKRSLPANSNVRITEKMLEKILGLNNKKN